MRRLRRKWNPWTRPPRPRSSPLERPWRPTFHRRPKQERHPQNEWPRIATGSTHLELDELVDLVETFAAILESARRRRAIDLHHEPTSERTVFKSQMAAVGCLLLLLTLLGLVVLLVLGAVLDPTGTRGGRAEQVGFLLKDDAFQSGSRDL